MIENFKIAKEHNYRYWNNKPIMSLNKKYYTSSNILPDDIFRELYEKSEQTKLPQPYLWKKVLLNESDELNNICQFLTKNYDRGLNTETEYIINYDATYIKWTMGNKGYFLLVMNNDSIIGLVGITTRDVQIYSKIVTMTEPVYMCVDKKFRHLGFVNVVLDEIVRLSTNDNLYYGICTTNTIVPSPIATIRQYSRPLNYKKLKENDFVDIDGIDDDVAHIKTKIHLKPNNKYIVAENTQKNIGIVYGLYTEYMLSFNVHYVLSIQDIQHYFFNEKYTKTILIFDEDYNAVDFFTYNYYDIINTNRTENNILRVANILMYSCLQTRSDIIFTNALKQMNKDNITLVYINDMMHSNEIILSNVKYSNEDTDDEETDASYDNNIIKTGRKYFVNLFNWKCEQIKQDMISLLIF